VAGYLWAAVHRPRVVVGGGGRSQQPRPLTADHAEGGGPVAGKWYATRYRPMARMLVVPEGPKILALIFRGCLQPCSELAHLSGAYPELLSLHIESAQCDVHRDLCSRRSTPGIKQTSRHDKIQGTLCVSGMWHSHCLER